MSRLQTEAERTELHDQIVGKIANQSTVYAFTEADLRRLARLIAEEVEKIRRHEKRRLQRVSPDEMLGEMDVRL